METEAQLIAPPVGGWTALSLIEPWLQLILNGKKTVEFRTWARNFKGDLLLCASKKWDMACAEHAAKVGWLSWMEILAAQTHRGTARALVEVRVILPSYEEAHGKEPGFYCQEDEGKQVWAWCLYNVRPIRPFPVKGMMGLFKVDHPVEMFDV